MIQSIRVINNVGDEITMELRSPEKSGFFINNITGLGPVKTNVNLSKSLWQGGATFNSSRSEPRYITFDIGFMNNHEKTVEELRLLSYRYFKNNSPTTIDIVTDTRRATAVGYVETNEPNIFSKDERSQISMVCPDPYFYGTELIQTIFSGVIGGFEFPFENRSLTEPLIEFATILRNTEANVYYSGDISNGVYILIEFLGAVTDPTINNTRNGQSMAFSSSKLITLTGANFQTGDLLFISTVKGNKTITLIRNGQTYNVLNIMTIVSDWITIQSGDNILKYTASAGLNNMLFSVNHQVVYEGL